MTWKLLVWLISLLVFFFLCLLNSFYSFLLCNFLFFITSWRRIRYSYFIWLNFFFNLNWLIFEGTHLLAYFRRFLFFFNIFLFLFFLFFTWRKFLIFKNLFLFLVLGFEQCLLYVLWLLLNNFLFFFILRIYQIWHVKAFLLFMFMFFLWFLFCTHFFNF